MIHTGVFQIDSRQKMAMKRVLGDDRWALADDRCFVKEEKLRIRLLLQYRADGATSGW
jgi:hypothetical protein